MITPDALRTRVRAIVGELTALRRELHSIPELAGQEFKTAALLRRELGEKTGLELAPPYLKTDIVGMLHGKGQGINVTLRADLDALPIQEPAGKAYASRHEKCMHACGHDGHSTMLFGAARVLSELAGEFSGSVRFVWQPGEEVVAMGKDLVDAGAIDTPPPALVAGIHGWPGFRKGAITTRAGAVMAASAHFKIVLTGRGGHGSAPQKTIDPVLAGARLIESLQSVISRECDLRRPAVLSICHFSAGSNSNIIPGEAILEGTARFIDDETGTVIERGIRRTLDGLALMTGVTYDLDYHVPYLPTVNDPEAADFAAAAAREYLGEKNFIPMPEPVMGGEDFCYYSRRYPAVYCHIGTGEDGTGLHHCDFDFPDEVIENGVIYLVALALGRLARQ